MKDKIAALLAKAAAATPGPWFPFCTDADECDQPSGVKGKELVVEGFYPHENSGIAMPDDARYIAACSPDAIQKLCEAYLKQAEALREALPIIEQSLSCEHLFYEYFHSGRRLASEWLAKHGGGG